MSNYGLTISFKPSADVTGRKAAYVDPALGTVANASVAASKCLGIFAGDTTLASGEPADVQTAGIAECIYGGSAQYGDSLTNDASGQLVTATGSAGTKVWCVGFALTQGAAAGDQGLVLVEPHLVVL